MNRPSPWRAIPFVLGLLASCAAPALAADLTRTYEETFRRDCGFGAAHVTRLRQHKVLLVAGYFGDIDPKYFADQLRWLDSLGIEREKVAVKARDSVAVNAPIVAAAIRASAKPVFLITHSKGSVDALEALRAEPALRTKVKGWVSLQGAFLGSPVADMLLDGSLIDPLTAIAILEFLGGTRASAQGLTTTASRAWYREHEAAIGTVLRVVPAVALTSALEDAPNTRATSFLEFSRQLMAGRGIASDGLVPADAAVLPGMDFVKVAGVDHIATVMPAQTPLDRVRMTRALLLVMRGPLSGLPSGKGCAEPEKRAGTDH